MEKPLTITKAVVVSGGGLKTDVVLKGAATQDIDGRTFVHLASRTAYTKKLMGIQKGPSACAAIIDQIMQLRGQEYKRCFDAIVQQDIAASGKEDLGLDGPARLGKRARVDVEHRLPTSSAIELPAVGHIASVTVQVIMAKGNAKVFIECTPTAINYLSQVCAYRRDHAQVAPTSADGEAGGDESKGIWKMRGRGGFKVPYKLASGKLKIKTFTKNKKRTFDEALDEAITFQSGLSSCSGSTPSDSPQALLID
jgi:hypothetical protein